MPSSDLTWLDLPASPGYFIALLLDTSTENAQHIVEGGFDACYTYFASETVSQASNPANWQRLADWAHGHGKDFIASVGPGYNDTRIRPWNSGASRDREGGGRYRRQWRAGIDSGADAISITSFNEWGEGTQIEPAADSYEDYIRALSASDEQQQQQQRSGVSPSECAALDNSPGACLPQDALGEGVQGESLSPAAGLNWCTYLAYGEGKEPEASSGRAASHVVAEEGDVSAARAGDPRLYLRITAEMAVLLHND